MSSSSTGLARGNGGVQEVAGDLVMACASAEVRERSQSLGTDASIGMPGRCPCTLWRGHADPGTFWASWARHGLVNLLLSSTNSWYRQVQGVRAKLADMVRERGEERTRFGHGGDHMVGMAWHWIFYAFSSWSLSAAGFVEVRPRCVTCLAR
jgi:hypothetical protein